MFPRPAKLVRRSSLCYPAPMPSTAAASAREILTGLHSIMAKRTNAQAKLDKVVHLIGEAMES